jgi:GrpB-like predicted nucleotidyltransferase (UPF0157 family)
MAEPLGVEPGTVRVVPYDERWPALFQHDARRIADAVAEAGLPTLVLEHVGSTAVPGLAAKPVLDIGAAHAAGTDPLAYVAVLASLGYVSRGSRGLPGREFFSRGEIRTHHLHLVELHGTHWRRLLRFRDALRADPAIRDAYAALKRALAVTYPGDRDAYMRGKGDFVAGVLDAERPARGV